MLLLLLLRLCSLTCAATQSERDILMYLTPMNEVGTQVISSSVLSVDMIEPNDCIPQIPASYREACINDDEHQDAIRIISYGDAVQSLVAGHRKLPVPYRCVENVDECRRLQRTVAANVSYYYDLGIHLNFGFYLCLASSAKIPCIQAANESALLTALEADDADAASRRAAAAMSSSCASAAFQQRRGNSANGANDDISDIKCQVMSPAVAFHTPTLLSAAALVFDGANGAQRGAAAFPRLRCPPPSPLTSQAHQSSRQRQLYAFADWRSIQNYPLFNASLGFMRYFDLTLGYSRNFTLWSADIIGIPDQIYRQTDVSFESKRKDAPLAVFVSNCNARARQNLLKRLLPLVPHHSYGKCFHNYDMRDEQRKLAKYMQKKLILSDYMFTMALENVFGDPDYVTEKLWHALESTTVPIYKGAPNVADYAPDTSSYVLVDDFQSVEALAQYIMDIFNDTNGQGKTTYERHHRWRRAPPPPHIQSMPVRGYSHCQLCNYIHNKVGG